MKKKILIVVAEYYKNISAGLVRSAKKELRKSYVTKIIFVPGIFEIPVTISKNIRSFNGFLALGCVIKGQTPHFDFISKATTDAIMKISIDSKKPIGNGIITSLNMNQAVKRINKGKEASRALISVLSQ
tara:strand:- start:402 stop:788 length:387 start_codon:yes stop_codon:yes gene_type:complete